MLFRSNIFIIFHMSKKRRIISVIIAVIVVLCAACLLYHYTRPSVNVVLSEGEWPLLQDYIPSGLLEPYNVRITLYPETSAADYVLYSPLSGILASMNEAVVTGAAVWGLSEVPEGFSLSFTPSEEKRWQQAYEEVLSPLASAVIYDESSSAETELAEAAPEEALRFPYSDSLSRVAAEEFRSRLEAEGVGVLYVYSPENVLNLLSGEDGYTLVVPLLYGKAFEHDSEVTLYLASEDFLSMFSSLGSEGALETPYTLLAADKGLKVMLDKLL